MYMPWGGTRTLLYDLTISSWLLLLCFSIPSLLWLLTNCLNLLFGTQGRPRGLKPFPTNEKWQDGGWQGGAIVAAPLTPPHRVLLGHIPSALTSVALKGRWYPFGHKDCTRNNPQSLLASLFWRLVCHLVQSLCFSKLRDKKDHFVQSSINSKKKKERKKERKKETTRASRILPPLWMRMVSIIPFSTHTESSSFYLLGIWSSQKAIHPCPNHLTF